MSESMTPERWRQVTTLFHAVRVRDAPDRPRYLDEACANDAMLRAEVEAMLSAHAETGRLSAVGPMGAAMRTQQLGSGTMIGPYRIDCLIGTGGMAEVYRARDTKLGRDVAVKVRAPFHADPERLARFEREARVLAALNHPHIAIIFGFEAVDGVSALVLELVDGETLAARIARGPIPLDQASLIARQIAEALEAAHEKGIVHRDLKPANVKITSAGAVKVLDFGIAKIYAGDANPDPLHPPTLTVGTREGMILGTAAYMSPEQARGLVVDKRTDIWAFGCVLYEMLTGLPAFPGETISDTVAAILDREPDWSVLSGKTPASVQRLLRRCLEKDPRRRLHDIADARIELDDAPASAEGSLVVAGRAIGRPNKGHRLPWTIAAVALIAAAAGLSNVRDAPVDANVYRTSLLLPTDVQLDCGCPPAVRFALSPDGRRLAFVGVDSRSGVTRLWVQPLDGGAPQAVAGAEGGYVPFWSPDGQSIGFFGGEKVKTVAVTGGSPMTVADNPTGAGATWNRDGVILFATLGPGNPIKRVSASGGPTSPATALNPDNGETRHGFPSFLPDGRHFLYLAIGSKTAGPNSANGIYVAALDSKERKLLVPGGSNAMYAQGHLFFLRQQTLLARPFDVERLEFTGREAPIAERVTTGGQTGTAGAFTVSPSGQLAYQIGPTETGGEAGALSQLIWVDRKGQPIGVLGDQAAYGDVELSPDGERLAVSVFDPLRRTRDIWLFDVRRRLKTRFTFDPADEWASIWSPNGSRVAFNAMRKGRLQLYQRSTNGADAEQELLASDVSKFLLDWSPDGRFILFSAIASTTGSDLWVLPRFGDRKPIPFLQTQSGETQGAFSPDGRWIAYTSNESGRDQVYVAPFPGPGGKWQVSVAGGSWPRWRRDGKEIFYVSAGNKLMAAAVSGHSSAFDVGPVQPLFDVRPGGPRFSYDVSPDGQRFLVNTLVEDRAEAPITLVVNWPALVKKQRIGVAR